MIKKEEKELFRSSLRSANINERKELIIRSINLVDKDKMNDWIKFVMVQEVPTNAIKGIVYMMDNMESDKDYFEIETSIFNGGEIDPRLYPLIACGVVNFSKNGEEYRKYWNK